MANWLNLRLVVTGRRADVDRFRSEAGALDGRIDTTKSTVFTREMEYGEGRDLEADLVRRLRRSFRRTLYLFQGRNTDHCDHFTAVSRRFPALAFVLVWSDPNADSHGSHLLLKGRRKSFSVPTRTAERILRKHYRAGGVLNARGEIDYDHDEADSAEWEAFFEMMDVAERHWDEAIFEWL